MRTTHGEVAQTQELFGFTSQPQPKPVIYTSLRDELSAFRGFGQSTRTLTTKFDSVTGASMEVPTFVNEFWTAGQRQAQFLVLDGAGRMLDTSFFFRRHRTLDLGAARRSRYRSLDQSDPGNRPVAEESIDPFDQLGFGVLDVQGGRP